MSVPLKPCPFCGGKSIVTTEVAAWWAICEGCFAEGPPAKTERDAIAAWNKREPDWEWKWSALVETVATRTDQARGEK